MDFLRIQPRSIKKGLTEIAPKFVTKSSKDLMIRGGDFYAIWDDKKGLWTKKQDDVVDLIDAELDKFTNEYRDKTDDILITRYMWDADSGSIDKWHKYVQKQVADNYHPLDETLVFANSPVRKEDYASKRLPYTLEEGDISAWDELVGTLYSPQERHKIEWAIGSIVSGDSKENQKFVVFYGEGGTGKSTILKIIKKLFDGYWARFDAKSLGSGSDAFSLEPFKDNPLIAIQDDGNLSKIEDNTRLNSLVSHEEMIVNEKFKKKYTTSFKTMLFMGTNNPVKITDARSGVIRRLIDISPTGKTFPLKKYNQLMKNIEFELGGIAWHCLQVYENDKYAYENYIPKTMIGASNAFYNFVQTYFDEFFDEDGTTLAYAWDKYNEYCAEAKIPYTYQKHIFKEELKAYFWNFDERTTLNGERVWNYYSGFRIEKFGFKPPDQKKEEPSQTEWWELKDASEFESNIFNETFRDCSAQYATTDTNEKPTMAWDDVKTTLNDIDTTQTHYVMLPANYISIDFDKKNEKGEKSLEANLEAIKDWPPTYAEVSKGGQGIHLEYVYTGDVNRLSRIFDSEVEIKVNVGKSSLRRRLSKCNNYPIATISSGLPLKGEKKVIDGEVIKNEKILRKFVMNCLSKKHWGYTAPEIDYLYSELEKCYESGMKYDISDMKASVIAFASVSTHQAQKCLRTVRKMHFKSEEISKPVEYQEEAPIVFFDVEIFPNLFILCYKFAGEKNVVALTNPDGKDISPLCKYRLVGFNNRKYDNHILYARMQGYTLAQLFNLSQNMIVHKREFFGEAYNLSYTDIYDFASAANKMSLKKWEIELDISHQELGLPWDQDVPEELWDKVIEYCKNDVEATEAAFNCDALHADFVAREILADIAGMTPNDTTNQLTTRIIFGNEKKPQKDFVYTDLSTIFPGYRYDKFGIPEKEYTGKIVNGKSIYRGIDPSEGGRVYAEPGIYHNVALLDIASMHPSSIENLNLFGPYTKRFSDIKLARVYIKHGEYDKAKELFDGKLSKYLDDPKMAKALSNALKTAINSVYGLTSASFDNPFKDPRNVDNIVAKRGALFMIELQLTLQEMGVKVAHVKTDSIKIPDATEEIIQFVMDFGKKYGYSFEHEATYDRLCLVNESVYIAKDANDGHWTATGAQFQVPYVFKTLFSHEPIVFKDLCETKSVTSALYLDFNEDLPEGEHCYTFVGKVGLFCPMKPGCGAGVLLREKDGKYHSATGAKGYLWMEAEMVRNLGLEDQIDRSYYDKMVNEAVETIEKFGDFEIFTDDSDVPF